MALLVLLAGPAPARVVAADLVLLVLDHGLLFGDRYASAVARLGVAFDRGRGREVCTGRRGDGRLAEGGWLLGGPPRVVEAAGLDLRRELLLRAGGDLDLDVEDQPRELLPDRVHERLEHR